MQILIVGGGGREHAIAWKLKQSPRVSRLYAAPGNAGIAEIAECVPIKATAIDQIVDWSVKQAIDLVFVAPDDPLALGLVDRLEDAGIKAFGPSMMAARVEASKSFAKQLMQKNQIPTADYAVFSELEPALAAVDQSSLPIVIKADGLALGKGVIIAQSKEEASTAVRDMLSANRFGDAGKTIIIESFLTGPELTVLAFTDGKTIKPMLSSRDHKRAYDYDQGPNTGGMGAVSPGADLSPQQWQQMQDQIFKPTIDALDQAGSPFKGVLYFGLMLTSQGPKVIEYNARFGDPEAQAVLPLLETDLLDIIEAILDQRLDQLDIKWKSACSCCVVAASGGYPGPYQVGYPISGLAEAAKHGLVFQAGTGVECDRIVTRGGRVLSVTAIADTLDKAIGQAYAGMNQIQFQDMHLRKDIGAR